jgi:hypothetical protein
MKIMLQMRVIKTTLAKRLSRIGIIAAALVLFDAIDACAQQQDFAVETNIIYHLTKYVEFPNIKDQSNFTIGIYGDNKIFEELRNGITGRRIGSQKIIVQDVDSLNNNLMTCSILFISENKSKDMKAILKIVKEKPVLLVTEKVGMLANGSCMNLIIADKKVKLEISRDNIEDRGLKVAAELLGMAQAGK